jgi:hypothetical protein
MAKPDITPSEASLRVRDQELLYEWQLKLDLSLAHITNYQSDAKERFNYWLEQPETIVALTD